MQVGFHRHGGDEADAYRPFRIDLVQTKAVAWLAQCLVAGSIPSLIVLAKLQYSQPRVSKSAKKTLGWN